MKSPSEDQLPTIQRNGLSRRSSVHTTGRNGSPNASDQTPQKEEGRKLSTASARDCLQRGKAALEPTIEEVERRDHLFVNQGYFIYSSGDNPRGDQTPRRPKSSARAPHAGVNDIRDPGGVISRRTRAKPSPKPFHLPSDSPRLPRFT